MRFYTSVVMVGNTFLLRGYEDGKRVTLREEYQPTLFVKTNRDTEYRTLDGEKVEPIKPGSVRDCREFFKKYEGVDGFKIYGNERYVYQYISDKYPEDEIQWDKKKMDIYSLDIETTTKYGFPSPEECQEEILLITIQNAATKQIITWGQKPYTPKQKNVTYHECGTEYDLLNGFIYWWTQNTPDVVTGWNTRLFDIPYICGRITRVFGEKKVKMLSPWGLVQEGELYVTGKRYTTFKIQGVSSLDYLDIYKKFTYVNRESYRLDHIAEVELGHNKLDHSEFDTFEEFYTKGWDKFVDYNIVDVELVDKLEDKLRLIELIITMAFDAKVNFNDPMGQVGLWDAIIYNYLKKQNIVIPPREMTEKNSKFAGAYVKEPVPGAYDWVVSFDLNSLYPHLLMQYNISPETLLDERHPSVNVEKILNEEVNFEMYKDYAVCANGAMFRKDKRGFLPELMERMYKERKAFKKEMLKSKQKLVDIEAEMKRRGLL